MDKRFSNWKMPNIQHGVPTKWNWLVLYPEGLTLGERTDIGAYTLLVAKYGIEVEDEVQIGSHCSIYSFSTIDGKQGKVTLRKNCKIGTHSSIMPGVVVGKNAIVGAHSFVTHAVPDNAIVAGVPAKVIRSASDNTTRRNTEILS